MHSVHHKLNQLNLTSSKNEKVELLIEYMEDEKFRIVTELALDNTVHFNINTLPLPKKRVHEGDFFQIIDFLHSLSEKQGATKIEKQQLADLCPDSVWEDVVSRILKGNLRCGVAAKLVNQALPGTITIMPYMRCSNKNAIENIVFPGFAQNKEDGMFVNIEKSSYSVKYLSRTGNEFRFPEDSLTKEIMSTFPETSEPMTYMGEFRVQLHGKYLPRKEGNGIINQALLKNQTITQDNARRIHFICWDVVPTAKFYDGLDNTPYEDRLKNISFIDPHVNERCHLIETKEVWDINDANAFAVEAIERGEEGAILKDKSAIWKNHTSTKQVKLKSGYMFNETKEADLKIIDWYYGKKDTKYQDCLGGFILQTEDGLLETRCGSGFSDSFRMFNGFDNEGMPIVPAPDVLKEKLDGYKGEIAAICFNEVIQDKKQSKPRLFLPTFVEIREDKDVADTYEKVLEL